MIPETRRAILARLRGDAALAALVSDRIYDTSPRGATYPLIAINQLSATEWDTDTTTGGVLTLAFSVFTRGPRARVDADAIGDLVRARLDRSRAALTLPSYTVVSCAFVSHLTFRDDTENGGAHCVVSFRMLVEQAAAASGA